jgi:hypothetical protein
MHKIIKIKQKIHFVFRIVLCYNIPVLILLTLYGIIRNCALKY